MVQIKAMHGDNNHLMSGMAPLTPLDCNFTTLKLDENIIIIFNMDATAWYNLGDCVGMLTLQPKAHCLILMSISTQ